MSQPTPTSTTVNSLKKLLLLVRNAEPATFERFVKELAIYTEEITVAVTDAPPESILVMQGRAQQARAFLRVFQECHLPPKQPFQPATP